VASLILTGIHAYLGVHVVERGVIFVDLALAQIAALGATVAIVVGMDPHGRGSYWISLGFTFLGAAIFAFARTRRGHIPQEAFIGIAYSVASAMAILLMSKATGGNRAPQRHAGWQYFGRLLAGSTQDGHPLCSSRHFSTMCFAKKFLLISMNHEKSGQPGRQRALLGFLVLRIVRICSDFVGCHRRRFAGVSAI